MNFQFSDGNFWEIPIGSAVPVSYIFSCHFNDLRFVFQCQVNFLLGRSADRKRADKKMFKKLANSVEEFIYALLDPLRSDKKSREDFGVNVLDHIIDEAIALDQKKVFLTA